MHPAHPLGVALGQVVVGRDDVHALAGQRVEVSREDAGQRLALAGPHLGDVAEVQRRAAHDLDVEVALAERALGGLADRGERLGQQVVESLAVRVTLLVLVGVGAQLGVAQGDEVVLDRVDLLAIRLSLRRILPSPARRTLSMIGGTSCRAPRGLSYLITVGYRIRSPLTGPACHRRRDKVPSRAHSAGLSRSPRGSAPMTGPADDQSGTSRRIIGAVNEERSPAWPSRRDQAPCTRPR